jgi:hypothetical protein
MASRIRDAYWLGVVVVHLLVVPAFGTITPERTLRPTGGAALAEFGRSVAVFNSSLLVGAPNEADTTPTVRTGAVYRFNLATGAVEGTLFRRPTFQNVPGFGTSLLVTGSSLFVGDPNFDTGPTTGKGAVHQFNLSTGAFVQTLANPGSFAGADDQFGYSLALAGNVLVIGAPQYDEKKGRVYAYDTSSGAFGASCKHPSALTSRGDEFGRALWGLPNGQVLIGAPEYMSGMGFVVLEHSVAPA